MAAAVTAVTAATAATTAAGATLDVLSVPGSRSSLHSSTSSRNSLVLSSPSPSFNQSLAASRSSPPRTPSLSSSASASVSASSSSSNISVSRADQEDLTITAPVKPNGAAVTADTTFDDIQVLAVSSHITELSYAISDIQTRIFEIQELRHKTQSTNADGPSAGPSTVIDKSLSALDDRLTSVQSGISTITTTLSPLLSLPQPPESDTSELSQLLRKHAAFAADWDAVQAESDVLREELKEDKWLTVFRTVTEQADGMMASLEKAVNRCQDFIWQVHRHAHERDELLSPSTSVSALSDRDGHINTNGTSKTPAITLEVHQALLDSFEAKKKHYMPATTKVLSIIDKGVQDRVTKNGECLRRHAESTQRWKALRDRIARTDAEMDNARRVLLNPPQAMSDSASSNAGHANGNGNGSGKKYLTPASKASSTSRDTLSRSMSPFRKLARHFGGSSSRSKLPATPTPAVPPVPTTPAGLTGTTSRRTPASEPNRTLRNRSSMFLFSSSVGPGASGTPPSPGHKYSASSAAVDLSSPGRERERYAMDEGATLKARGSPAGKIPWNSSTKVEDDSPGIARSRKPSGSASGSASTSTSGQQPPYKRSLSRASVSGNNAHSRAPSRGAGSGYGYGYGTYSRPPSRAQTPTSTAAYNPRARPRTPSNTPAPPATSPGSAHRRGASVAPSDASLSTSTSGFVGASPGGARTRSRSRAGGGGLSISASMSTSTNTSGFSTQTTDDAPEFDSPPRGGWRAETPGGTRIPHPRPPSRSMIPAPKLALSTPSRPGSAMSDYFTRGAAASPTPSTPFRTMAMRAQTPESTLRLRAGNALSALPPTPRTPSFGGGGTLGRSANGPPSSFREMAPSRAGGGGQQLYVPANARDPLEVEVAAVVNSFAHGMTVERVDPPLRTVPKDGEMKAQYAFSSVLGRKVLTVRLTTLARPGGGTGSKKVMVRVGGGWVDLAEWMSSRPA